MSKTTNIFLLALVMPLTITSGSLANSDAESMNPIPIVFDHSTGASPGAVSVREGRAIQLKVLNTYPECFRYNYRSVEVKEPEKASSTADRSRRRPAREDVLFPTIVHDGTNRDYLVTVEQKSNSEVDCSGPHANLRTYSAENPWTAHVRTYGWALGFAGSFTRSELTNPVYSLKEVGSSEDDMQSPTMFEVIEMPELEDEFELGAGAMIHLFHSDPNANRLLRYWAPISFGLSLENGDDLRYFLGTSLRFHDDFFVTAGIAYGNVDRLPNGLDLADNRFTTDSNALQTLGRKSESAVFFSVSYKFLGGKKRFEDALKAQPAPDEAAKPTSGGDDDSQSDSSDSDSGDGDGDGQTAANGGIFFVPGHDGPNRIECTELSAQDDPDTGVRLVGEAETATATLVFCNQGRARQAAVEQFIEPALDLEARGDNCAYDDQVLSFGENSACALDLSCSPREEVSRGTIKIAAIEFEAECPAYGA